MSDGRDDEFADADTEDGAVDTPESADEAPSTSGTGEHTASPAGGSDDHQTPAESRPGDQSLPHSGVSAETASVGNSPGTGRLAGQPSEKRNILEYTTDRRSLSPRVRLQWGVWTTVSVAILAGIVTAVLSVLDFDPRLGGLALVVFFVLGMGWVVLRYRLWVYQVREDALYLERGVVTHVRTLVPYVRIQHVDTSRGPLERALGLSTLVVYTAGSRGADVSVPGLTPEEAHDLQQRVKQLAIEAEGGDAV